MFTCIIETIFTNNRNEQDKKQIILSAMSKIYNVKVNEEEKQTIDHQKECNTQDIEETKVIEEIVEARHAGHREDYYRAFEKLDAMVQDDTNKLERLNKKLSEKLSPPDFQQFRRNWEILQRRKMPSCSVSNDK